MEEKKGKKFNGIALFGAVLVTVILWIGCFIVLKKSIQEVPTTQIVVFAKDINGSSTKVELNSANVNEYLTMEDVIETNVPANTYTSINDVIKDGRVFVSGDYLKHEALTSNKTENEIEEKDKYTERVETSFKVSSFDNAVCGRVRAGDRINITVVDNTVGLKYQINDVYVEYTTTSDGTIINANDNSAIAVGFKVWLNSYDLEDFSKNLANGGTVSVSKIVE